MLIKYEYELLSCIALKGVRKVNGDIVVPFKRIEEELIEENINTYFQLLEANGIIEVYEDKVIIIVNEWITFFIDYLSDIFSNNNMKVICKRKENIRTNNNDEYIEFIINGSSKEFVLMFNNFCNDCENKKDVIFMCNPNIYTKEIYWIELINNINLLNQFYSYLINESNYINKTVYRELNIFEGIDDKYIIEIFNVSIKRYFSSKKNKIKNFDKEEYKIIRQIYLKDDISYYGVEFANEVLWLILDKKKIVFLSLRDGEVTYSKEIEKEIDMLQEKVSNKISEFKALTLFKENNVLDSTLKIVGQISTFFVPTSMIMSILALINININLKSLANYRPILICSIIVLGVVQYYLLKVIYWPAFKISKFSWKIK